MPTNDIRWPEMRLPPHRSYADVKNYIGLRLAEERFFVGPGHQFAADEIVPSPEVDWVRLTYIPSDDKTLLRWKMNEDTFLDQTFYMWRCNLGQEEEGSYFYYSEGGLLPEPNAQGARYFNFLWPEPWFLIFPAFHPAFHEYEFAFNGYVDNADLAVCPPTGAKNVLPLAPIYLFWMQFEEP